MWKRRKTSSRLSRELDHLRRDVDALSQRARDLLPGQTGGRNHLMGLAPWRRPDASPSMSDAFWGAATAASRGAEQMSHQIDDVFADAMRIVRRRPVPAGLALLAIGLVIGLAARKAS